MTAAIPLIIGIADFTWHLGDLTFTGIALGSIAALRGLPRHAAAGPADDKMTADDPKAGSTMMRHALVRRPSPRLADGLITHIERSDHVDAELAQRQWDGYVAALRDAGWTTHEVPAAPDCPDSVFVEDTMVVYGDLAVISRPGAEERWPEIPAAEDAVRAQGYRVARIEAPGTLDGGDVLKHDGTVWVGIGGRTNAEGIAQLTCSSAAVRRRRGGRARDEGTAPQVRGHRASRRHDHRLRTGRRRSRRLGRAVPRRARGAWGRTSCSSTTTCC